MKTIEIYCISCKKKLLTKIQMSEKLTKTDQRFLSSCAISVRKKSTFIKNQELHNLINTSND